MYTRSAQKRPPGVFSTPFFFSNAASTQPEAGAHTCKAGLGKPPTLRRCFLAPYVRQRVFPERKRARRHVCAPASGVTLCPLIPNLNSL